jgi:hypothetical protein
VISAVAEGVRVVLISHICDLLLTPDNQKITSCFILYDQIAAVSLTYYVLLSALTGKEIAGY